MKRVNVKAVLLGLTLFSFFLVWRFPYRNLRGWIFERIYKESKVRVEAEDLVPAIFGWPGVELKDAQVSVPTLPGEFLNISASSITIRGGLAGILPPVPMASVYFRSLKEGGNLYVRLANSNSNFFLSSDLSKVEMKNFPIPGLSETFQGQLSGSSVVDIGLKDPLQTYANISFSSPKLTMPPINYLGIVFPEILFEAFDALIQTADNAITIKKFSFGKPESGMKAQLTGGIRLEKTWAESKLNLVLRVQLSEELRNNPMAATLTSFLNSFQAAAPGDYAMQWNATIGKLMSDIGARIPQRL